MSNDLWRWADPDGQQRRVRLDELRAALAGGVIAPNTPVWRAGWKAWQPAHEVPELTTSAVAAANGVVQNIPPPPLAMIAVQQEFESKGGGSFRPPPVEPVNGASTDDEPPPPPKFVPLAVKPTSIPPAAPSSSPATGAGAQKPLSSLPTAIGLPPPPELAAMVAASKEASAAAKGSQPPPGPAPVPAGAAPPIGNTTTLGHASTVADGPGPVSSVDPNGKTRGDPMIEELSGSMLLDDGSAARIIPPLGDGSLPPPTDPVVHGPRDGSLADDESLGLPPRRPNLTAIFDDFQAIKAGKPPKNKLLLAVIGILAFSVLIMFIALIVSAFSGKPSEVPSTASASASASASAAPPETAASAAPPPTTTTAAAASTTAAAVTPPPKEDKPAGPSLGDCVVGGDAHIMSPRVFIPSAVEANALPNAIALGFATTARESTAIMVDPSTLAITGAVKGRALGGDARRVSPVVVQNKLAVVTDVDKKDRLMGRRVVATTPPIDIGVAENAIVWAPHGGASYAKLWPLDGDGAVDAIRAVPLAGSAGKGIAITFRRGAAVFAGVAKGDSVLVPDGTLSRIAGLGPQVGSPAINTSGDAIVLAWADRANTTDSWMLRWTKMTAGAAPDAPRDFALPEGGLGSQAMSPSIAGLGAGRFLLAWTEGPVSNHQVRALNIGADGAPSGAALSVSAAGLNAGQPQVAIGADGRGVVAFLAKGKAFYEIHGTPLTCK